MFFEAAAAARKGGGKEKKKYARRTAVLRNNVWRDEARDSNSGLRKRVFTVQLDMALVELPAEPTCSGRHSLKVQREESKKSDQKAARAAPISPGWKNVLDVEP